MGWRSYFSTKFAQHYFLLNQIPTLLFKCNAFTILIHDWTRVYSLVAKAWTSYINLLLKHSRKYTTTSLGGSCRVDFAFTACNLWHPPGPKLRFTLDESLVLSLEAWCMKNSFKLLPRLLNICVALFPVLFYFVFSPAERLIQIQKAIHPCSVSSHLFHW